jgi:zinc protease
MQQEGPPADLVARVAESTRREHEIALRQNGFWLGRLQSAWLLDRDPVLMLHREDRIDAVTRDGLREMFRAYFPLDRYTILTFLPAR